MVGEDRVKLNPVPDLRKLRLFFMEDDGGSPLSSSVDKEIRLAMQKAIKHMESKYGIKAQVSGQYYTSSKLS
jgi:hypothetical protein